MSECNSVDKTYYQKNGQVVLNRGKNYYKNDKEVLRKQARDKEKKERIWKKQIS